MAGAMLKAEDRGHLLRMMRRKTNRVVLAVLREAGKPLPIRAIAVRALASKGINLPSPMLRRAIRKRLRMAIIALDKRGVTVNRLSLPERD